MKNSDDTGPNALEKADIIIHEMVYYTNERPEQGGALNRGFLSSLKRDLRNLLKTDRSIAATKKGLKPLLLSYRKNRLLKFLDKINCSPRLSLMTLTPIYLVSFVTPLAIFGNGALAAAALASVFSGLSTLTGLAVATRRVRLHRQAKEHYKNLLSCQRKSKKTQAKAIDLQVRYNCNNMMWDRLAVREQKAKPPVVRDHTWVESQWNKTHRNVVKTTERGIREAISALIENKVPSRTKLSVGIYVGTPSVTLEGIGFDPRRPEKASARQIWSMRSRIRRGILAQVKTFG
jgi:hypothetical protein